jgi:Ca-activated chloride channel family protein
VFDKESPANSLQASIPRLWATRKIGFLLNKIRLEGASQEIIDQIVRLSIRYGIVTPYTSYLVTDKAPLGEAEQQRLVNEAYGQIMAMPTAAPSGPMAVQSAADAGSMQGAGNAPELTGAASTTVRLIGSRTYVLSDGKWIDTAFDPDTMQTIPIDFLSQDYFTLVTEQPELADAFALGDQVIALSDGVAYEVVPSTTTAQVPDITPTPTQHNPITPTSTPGAPGVPTQTPTLDPPKQPSGFCGAGIFPFILVPFLMMIINKPKRQ